MQRRCKHPAPKCKWFCGYLAHVALCEFNKPALSCLTWPQSCPVHLGYTHEGRHKILAVLHWSFPHFYLITSVNLHDDNPQIQTIAPYLPLVIARVFECLISLEHMAKRLERSLGHSHLSRLTAFCRYLCQPAFQLQTRDFVLYLLKSAGKSFVYSDVKDK